MTSRFIRGTALLAICRTSISRSPVAPEIVPPWECVAPVIPTRPTPAPAAPSPIVPAIAPCELKILIRNPGHCLGPHDDESGFANGGKPLGDRRLSRGRWTLGGGGRQRRAKQQRRASRSHWNNPR